MKRPLITLLILCVCLISGGQDLQYAKTIIKDLCSTEYKGRGYVGNGVNQAADYLEARFDQMHLRKFGCNYSQRYSFPVNTHPYKIRCDIDKEAKAAGYDFLVDAGCPDIKGHYDLIHFNTKDSLDKILLYKKIEKGFLADDALVLHHQSYKDKSVYDSCKEYGHFPALFITTEDKKLTHTISRSLNEYPSLTFIDSTILNKDSMEIDVKHEWIDSFTCKNLMGYIKGKKTDSLIVFSAHYDHLGMQGISAMFPGASDNASGVSMVLYLAEYYSRHRPDYSIAFLLFSGEEAGLMGSHYFTEHPSFDLKKIRFLINIDIMGNAEKGIVVVNGEEYRKQFDILKSLNDTLKLLPEVRIRGKAKNSDHYYFAAAGVPSIFIYSDGGVGFYHDVFDVANSINLTNYEQVAQLLISFVKKL